MPIFKANFADVKFDQIEGFRISIAFTPRRGFEGNFFVYIADWVDADKAFDDSLKVADDNKGRRADLIISDGSDVTYKFPDIDLTHAVVGATRSIRYRFLEFQYHQNLTDRSNPVPISLENKINKKLTVGALQQDYDFKVDDSPESLLGFRARLSPNESSIVRFSSLRNNSNSFMNKLVEVAKSQANSGGMMPFNIEFKQQKFEINRENLQFAYVDESFGTFVPMPLASIDEILRGSTHAAELSRLKPDEFTPEQLLDHDIQGMRQRFVTSDIVETATLVFQPGVYRDLDIK